LLATCGSDPIDLAPPFGGKHGTRPKMSPVDFATSLTFSIVLVARLFCCAGLAWSTAATLPAPAAPLVRGAAGVAVSDLALSDLVLSDLAPSDLALSDLAPLESAACWATWARTGSICAGVSNTIAATANAASDVIRQKGR
jgi:hypothetical protein